MSIASLPEWLACRAIPSWPKQYAAAEIIFKALSATELDDLISIAESGYIDDQHVALSTLDHFSRAKLDARWTTARRNRLALALRKHVVERYPDPIARHSVSVLQIMDLNWLDEFLTGISSDQISEQDRQKLVYDLSNMLTERSRERLLELIEAGWEGTESVKWPLNRAAGSFPLHPAADEWDYNPHTRVTGPLLSSPEWKHLLMSQNPLQEVELWLNSITESDLSAVVEAWEDEGNDATDRRCAGVVIRQLGQRNDSRLPAYRARILNRAHSLGARIFQETGILPSEYYVIRDLCRESAIDFLLACLDSEKLDSRHRQSSFHELMMLGGPRAIAHIEQLAAQGGSLAKVAATFLDERGPVTPEKIAAKSEHWRKSHNAQDLKWLFFRHLEPETPKGSRIEMILSILGEPSKRGERFCEWTSGDSPIHKIYLETDESGKLDWMKFYVNDDSI